MIRSLSQRITDNFYDVDSSITGAAVNDQSLTAPIKVRLRQAKIQRITSSCAVVKDCRRSPGASRITCRDSHDNLTIVLASKGVL